MNIRDPNLPFNLTSFRALQEEIARLDAALCSTPVMFVDDSGRFHSRVSPEQVEAVLRGVIDQIRAVRAGECAK